MDSIIFLAFALAYIGLIIFLWRSNSVIRLSSVLFLVLLALVYDNLIIGIGRFIGEGDLLETLNLGRFWLHAFFTPTLIIFSLAILQDAGVRWAKSKAAKVVAGILFLSSVGIEIVTQLKGLTIAPSEEYGALSYSSVTEASGPPIMILIVVVTLLVAAFILMKQFKWWWMLLGIILMAIGGAVLINIPSNATTNFLELLLSFTLVLTKNHFSTKNHN